MTARYDVEAVVGRGAMGVVYRARQTGAGGRLVAYKRVATDDAVLRARLRREAEVLAELEHPNIIRIYDVVDDETGMAIVMQYAGGGSLADRLAASIMSPGDAATVLIALADALDCAHRRSVLHRDIKPGNILFTADGHPLLSDFGIARRGSDAPLTEAGVLGPATAEYLDPAVADGRVYDERSDIYALGVVGYEMLAGRRPHQADTPLAILRAADREDRPRLARVAPDAPPALAGAVEAALARDPEQRPQTAADFAARLRVAVSAAPVQLARRHAVEPGPASVDRDEPPTRLFGPRPPKPAEPPLVTPSVPWWRVAVAAVALVFIPSAVVIGAGEPPAADTASARPPTAAALPALPAARDVPVCSDVTVPPATRGWTVLTGDLAGTGCRSWARHRRGVLEVDLPGSPQLRLRLGQAGDTVLLGDWNCDGSETVALYRRDSGDVFTFDAWPARGRGLRSSTPRSTGIVGGVATSTSAGHCDEVVVTPALGT